MIIAKISFPEKRKPRHQHRLFSTSPPWGVALESERVGWTLLSVQVLTLPLPSVASIRRSNSFPAPRNSYRGELRSCADSEPFTDGMTFATGKGRRSGAQRGASENNFGQRFSVSTPCFFSKPTKQPSPPTQNVHSSRCGEYARVWVCTCGTDTLVRPGFDFGST